MTDNKKIEPNVPQAIAAHFAETIIGVPPLKAPEKLAQALKDRYGRFNADDDDRSP